MPIRGEATAKLGDGRKLTLVVNFATLAKTAAQTGIVAKDVLPVLGDQNDPRQMLVMIAMVQHAMHRHHRNIDEDDVGEMMLTDDEAISQALMAGVQGAFGEEEGGDDASSNPPKAKRPSGTGTSSKPRGRKRA